MPRVAFSSKTITALPAPVDRKFIEYSDDRMPGLILRISAGGTKSWNALYRSRGRARRLTIGRYPAVDIDTARSIAREAMCEVARGNDPADAKARGDDASTFADLADAFIDGHVRKLRRATPVQRLIQRELVRRWSSRKADEITRRDVAVALAEISMRAPVVANRTLAVLRRMYAWGIGQGIVEANPCDMVERPTTERPRERVLTSSELSALWASFNGLSPSWAALFRLCLLTGQRVGEVLTMRWDDIDGDWWIIPTTKNGHAHRVPLTPQALEIVRALPRRSSYAFSSASGSCGALRGYRKAFRRACAVADLANARVHDLRRTAASMMASLGVSRVVIGQILNHSSTSVTAIYDRYSYDAEKRAAMHLWAQHLLQMTA